MRHFLLLLVLFSAWFSHTNATNYYFSNSGNDTLNTGKAPSSSFQTIDKLNKLTLAAGDSIFFKSGETFFGEIKISQSGTSQNPIVFTSYENGNPPIISGSISASNWTLNGNTYIYNSKYKIYNAFLNGKEQIPARYPNSGYLQLDSSIGNNGLRDNELNIKSTGYWDGAKICVRTCQWVWETTTIASYSPGLLNYKSPTQIPAIQKYGYYLYNKFEELDTANEWFFDSTSNKLYYMAAVGKLPTQNDFQVSVFANGMRLTNKASFIHISNLHFDKQFNDGILLQDSNSTHILISKCIFSNQFNNGIELRGSRHEVGNCEFNWVDGKGIEVNKKGYSEIHHCTFKHIGMYQQSGSGKQTNLEAIGLQFVDSCYIHHNHVDSVGYTGIHADGNGHLVERNIVSHCMLLLNDGAPLKSFGKLSTNVIWRNNFVSASNGNTEATYKASFKTPGIYFDFDVHHCLIENNTIYNQNLKGIFLNGGNNNNIIRGNIIYGSLEGIDLNAASRDNRIEGEHITHNVIFGLDKTHYALRETANRQPTDFLFGLIDSNYYFNPYELDKCAYRMDNGMTSFSLENWQQQTGHDIHSRKSYLLWPAGENHSVLFMNPTDNDSTIVLGTTKYLDLDSMDVCGSFILKPYTSKILIQTATNCAIGMIDPVRKESIKIYPNPAREQLYIEATESESISTIQCFNNLGQLLEIPHIKRGSGYIFDISGFDAGVYYFSIQSKRQTITEKILVVK
jgi:parallel beta-helix repeat protein